MAHMALSILLTVANVSRRSKYPIFENSGSKSMLFCSIWALKYRVLGPSEMRTPPFKLLNYRKTLWPQGCSGSQGYETPPWALRCPLEEHSGGYDAALHGLRGDPSKGLGSL